MLLWKLNNLCSRLRASLWLPLAALQDELERLKAENARLFRDNERFMRLVSMTL
jgi:hypothetical protein